MNDCETIETGSLEHGGPTPRGPATVPATCAYCHAPFERGEVTVEFSFAPEATRVQRGPGWLCVRGHTYIDGESARLMHARAFGKR